MTTNVAGERQLPASTQTLGQLMFARLALNLQYRIVYPFLPAISRGLGVPLETASLLLTARALVGISSPVYGYLADRSGRRLLMLVGLLATVAGCALAGIAPGFGAALAAFLILGFAKASYDPAMQAYVADTVPYERRGRVLGLLELVWAGSWLIGVPAAGFLIARAGWRAPFLVIGGLAVISLLAFWRLVPIDWRPSRSAPSQATPSWPGSSTKDRRLSWITRSALMALAVSALMVLANENVFIVYGAWLESRFGLTLTALGLASIVISLAELAAEGAAAGLVDRIGKRRAVLGGLLLNAVAYLLLPRVAISLGGALAGVVLMFLTFEFSIVCMLPLVSELAPDARGTLMALNVAAMSFGRMFGSLSGPRLWGAGGLSLNATVSAAIVLVAALGLWLLVRESGNDGGRLT